MNKETLQKANKLAREIKEHEQALDCFEADFHGQIISRNPRLIIEHDDDDDDSRYQQTIPIELSEHLIKVIKEEINSNLEKLRTEFIIL